jgi:hypothetical protein
LRDLVKIHQEMMVIIITHEKISILHTKISYLPNIRTY